VLRVVVDPNVFVSAVIKPSGVSAAVVRAGLPADSGSSSRPH